VLRFEPERFAAVPRNSATVLAGIFVWRDHHWWVRWTSRSSGFFLGAFAVAIIAFPFLFPIALGVRETQAHPLESVGLAIYGLGAVSLLVWIHWQLRSLAVVPADPSARVRWTPSVLGAALAIGIVTLVGVTLHGASSRTAIELAHKEVGPGYRFWISNLSVFGEHGRARVLAYNDSTIQTVNVDW